MNGVIWWEKLEWMYGDTLLKSLNVTNKHAELILSGRNYAIIKDQTPANLFI